MSTGRDVQTDGAPREPRRPRPPWGVLGMLGLVLLVEGGFARNDADFAAPWHWDWRVLGKLASKKQAGADTLLFGDSTLKFGVMPRVVADRAGGTAYSFALHTGQTSSSYFMLRRVLDSGHRPKRVVLDLTPHMLAHDPDANASLWPELLSPAECLDMAWAMGSGEFFGATMAGHFVPSVHRRHDIRAALMAQLGGRPSQSRRAELPAYRRNWKRNDGGQLMPDGASPPIDPDFWVKTLYPAWKPCPLNVAYLDRFLALARERGIAVSWLLAPVQPGIQERTEASGFDADYTRFVRETAGRFANVTVVDARHSGFQADEFNDGIHLKRPGALRLSVGLGNLLRDGAGSRWVALDAGRPRSVDLPIEDVGQSIASLRAEGSPARR